jgi:VanZ family protein
MPGDFYPQVDIVNVDKILHMGIYGLLAMLCYISLIHTEKVNTFTANPLMWTLIIGSLYGVSDEFHQLFVPNRSCDFWDWVADASGVIIAVILIKNFLSKKMKLFGKKLPNNPML